MAVMKDWAITAAVDIIDNVRSGTTLEWVAERIHAHCPFLPHVAYMPVPCCDSCKHWTQRPEYVEPHGACDADAIGSDCNDYTIIVPADFGCVQWEAK